jgi:hypothetical protein
MKIKVLIWGFAGSDYRRSPYTTSNEDAKYSEITPTKNGAFFYREFDGMEGKTIKVTDTFNFCGLMRFFYKGYCCVLGLEDFQIIK